VLVLVLMSVLLALLLLVPAHLPNHLGHLMLCCWLGLVLLVLVLVLPCLFYQPRLPPLLSQ
jgi:cellobiose-specific phosphotransferase system component IIC